MFSRFRTLLVAATALPLAAGFAFAQSAQPTTAPVTIPPAVAATAAPTAPLPTVAKKATQQKTSATGAATKTAAMTHPHVKKHAVVKTKGQAGKPTASSLAHKPGAAKKPIDAASPVQKL